MKKVLIGLLLFTQILKADIKVMVIDTGTDLSHEEILKHVKYITPNDYVDNNSHGTHVSGLVLKDVCDEVELISCKYFDSAYDMEKIISCIKRAINLKVDFINFSSVGDLPYSKEYTTFKEAIDNDIKAVVAAGNNNHDLSKEPVFPAGYDIPGLIVVGNMENYVTYKAKTSNYGKEGMVWEIGENVYSTLPNGKWGYMSGTSMATAIHTNRLIKRKCNDIRH